MYLPNWMFGLLPEDWWPDRPREPVAFTQNVVSLAAASTVLVELTLDKANDVLVWGGVALVTSVPSGGAAPTIFGPTLASATTPSQVAVSLQQPSGGRTFTQSFQTVAGLTTPAPNNLVPLESLFASGQRPGNRIQYWPVPIRVRKGGSLGMALQNVAGAAKQVRITFFISIMYPLSARLPRAA